MDVGSALELGKKKEIIEELLVQMNANRKIGSDYENRGNT